MVFAKVSEPFSRCAFTVTVTMRESPDAYATPQTILIVCESSSPPLELRPLGAYDGRAECCRILTRPVFIVDFHALLSVGRANHFDQGLEVYTLCKVWGAQGATNLFVEVSLDISEDDMGNCFGTCKP